MRTAGLLLMAAAPVLFGCNRALRYRREQQQIEEFISLVEVLRHKIRYYKLPLCDIYADLQLPHLSQFCDDLKEKSFREALFCNRASLFIGKNCFESLALFSAMLGKSGCDEQVRNCDAVLEILTFERNRLRNEVPKQMKLSLSIGGMAGAMALLLFL